MRKQPALLEHIADAPAVRRHVDARRGIEQHRIVERDAAAIGRDQPGDQVDERGLAGAGGSEQRGHAARALELRGERELAEPLFDVDGEHRHSPWKRVPARRASHSEATSAASEIAIATSTRRPAAASPPGIWVKV